MNNNHEKTAAVYLIGTLGIIITIGMLVLDYFDIDSLDGFWRLLWAIIIILAAIAGVSWRTVLRKEEDE